jgi:hypothetical protein
MTFRALQLANLISPMVQLGFNGQDQREEQPSLPNISVLNRISTAEINSDCDEELPSRNLIPLRRRCSFMVSDVRFSRWSKITFSAGHVPSLSLA